jgi:hypothetical protein
LSESVTSEYPVFGAETESLTPIEKLYCPATVGVPFSSPVTVFRVIPAGNGAEPSARLKIYGQVPPVTLV